MIGKNGNLGCLDRFSHSTENSEEPTAKSRLKRDGPRFLPLLCVSVANARSGLFLN
jgi:hypothetical protein